MSKTFFKIKSQALRFVQVHHSNAPAAGFLSGTDITVQSVIKL